MQRAQKALKRRHGLNQVSTTPVSSQWVCWRVFSGLLESSFGEDVIDISIGDDSMDPGLFCTAQDIIRCTSRKSTTIWKIVPPIWALYRYQLTYAKKKVLEPSRNGDWTSIVPALIGHYFCQRNPSHPPKATPRNKGLIRPKGKWWLIPPNCWWE